MRGSKKLITAITVVHVFHALLGWWHLGTVTRDELRQLVAQFSQDRRRLRVLYPQSRTVKRSIAFVEAAWSGWSELAKTHPHPPAIASAADCLTLASAIEHIELGEEVTLVTANPQLAGLAAQFGIPAIQLGEV